MKNILFLTLLSLPYLGAAQSVERQVIGAAGAYSEGNSHSQSYTVGEVITETHAEGTIVLAQGFQQGDDSTVDIVDLEGAFQLNAYPNPTMDAVYLDVQSEQTMNLSIRLFDMEGRMVLTQTSPVSKKAQLRIDMQQFASGNYILRIADESKQLNKSIRVQKLN